MDAFQKKLHLTPEQMQTTGFPGELDVSYETLMALRGVIGDEQTVIDQNTAASDELSHTEMAERHIAEEHQAVRRVVAGEIANRLGVQRFFEELDALPTTDD